MAEFKFTLKLSEADLRYLRRALQEAAAWAEHTNSEKILDAAFEFSARARAEGAPEFALRRLETLEAIATLLRDREYPLPAAARGKLLRTLAYFAHSARRSAVLGFLEDAVVIEIASAEFQDEIKGYEEFCRFRGNAVQRYAAESRQAELERALSRKRKQIRARLQARRQQRDGGARPRNLLFRFW